MLTYYLYACTLSTRMHAHVSTRVRVCAYNMDMPMHMNAHYSNWRAIAFWPHEMRSCMQQSVRILAVCMFMRKYSYVYLHAQIIHMFVRECRCLCPSLHIDVLSEGVCAPFSVPVGASESNISACTVICFAFTLFSTRGKEHERATYLHACRACVRARVCLGAHASANSHVRHTLTATKLRRRPSGL